MNEQKIEAALTAIMERNSKAIKDAVAGAIDDCHVELMPYLVDDAQANAAIQAGDLIRLIAEGEFEFDDDYAVVRHPRAGDARVRIQMTSSQYDSLRDNLIQRMPECPKDAKIRELESRIDEMNKRGYL